VSYLRPRLTGLLHVTTRMRRGRGERGGVAVLVAIVLGFGALTGSAAMTVDVGQLYLEREELQSGADAAALGVARYCVQTPSSCNSQTTHATALANSNATDGATAVTLICGTGQGLSACPAQMAGLGACNTYVPAGAKYVEVRTATKLADGSTLLPPAFAGAVYGNYGYAGKTVHACSRAVWGAPSSGTGAAFTLSICEWNEMTDNGTTLQAPPPAVPPHDAEGLIHLHGSSGASTCGTSVPAGWDAPGGFGWLAETGGACKATATVDGEIAGNTGVSASGTCQTALANARNDDTVLMVPVYDRLKGTGSSITYHIVGFSAFVVTGYALSGFAATGIGCASCSGSQKCIYGYFTSGILPLTGTLGAASYGVVIITMGVPDPAGS